MFTYSPIFSPNECYKLRAGGFKHQQSFLFSTLGPIEQWMLAGQGGHFTMLRTGIPKILWKRVVLTVPLVGEGGPAKNMQVPHIPLCSYTLILVNSFYYSEKTDNLTPKNLHRLFPLLIK